MVFVLAPATIVLMMMVLVAVAVQETARRRRKQQKQQYFQQTSPTTKSSDDLEIGTLTPLPGPTPIPFFGNLLSLRKYSECPYQGFSELKDKYGPVYALKMGSTPSVVVNTFDTIKEVLINKANSFDARPDLLRFKLYFGGNRQHCEYLQAAPLPSLFTPGFLNMPHRTTFLSPLNQAPFISQP
ncbi:Cytochrome P450 307a1 [Portunus trituberculatus]|uniref:Cytochrome P450 307a1 n=1 Tax=Portunus trituberculatus TaxID=210409 RepID=A0A5B7EHL8_PORTR|nr:Cytochrome P450 307a1 [Portunus trituberculatus]